MVKIFGRPEMDTEHDIINLSYTNFANDIHEGDEILFDDVLGIQGARDPIRLINSYPASEEPRFCWEEHLQDGKLILRLRLSELPREEQK